MKNVEWVEVQPFHQMGAFKWKATDTQVTAGAGRCSRVLRKECYDPQKLNALILTAFLAIGLGYLVGQISIGGFSLGVGAVLFVGLAIGAFAPKAQITGPIGLTGLIMFLYGIGILYGRQFFEGMRGVGRMYNLLALIACVAGLLVALGLGQVFGIKIGHTLGLYAGSMTSTASLQ